ncbi:Zn-ribbon domain-containing OB-fold protein [Haliea sp.]
MEKIQPTPGTLAESFIAGCRVGELRLQCCDSCGTYQFYPRIICADCHGRDLSWVAASGRGQISSFTVVRRPISAAYEAPYVVALVALEEGPTMMSHIVACTPEDVAVGLSVRVDFAAWSDSTSLPVFTLASRD